jgi:chromosome partitioning protein
MPARILTIAQQKGGAGKTSLTAHLAAAFAGQGHRVALIDIDPQGSLTAWAGLRPAGFDPHLNLSTVSGWRTGPEVERQARDHDIVLIDCPPHGETAAKLAVRAADLIVVPMQPSPLDLWATRATIALIAGEKRPLRLVLNRVPARGSLSDAMARELAETGAPIAEATLGNRQAFAAALVEGLGVTEYEPRGQAAAEMTALADELLATLSPARKR